ncbi:O-antigen ligase family protein [Candidatus Saganbacteria bacterium]|nr:O-antigen ligase family protein [Candidatus Saganbacteria bacterium]
MVIDLKVPVKIYELAFLLFLFFWFTHKFLQGEAKLDYDRGFRPLIYFFIWALFVTMIGYLSLLKFNSFPEWVARGSIFLNPAIELAYFLLNILLAIFIAKLVERNKDDVKAAIYILMLSNLLVCIYGMYLLLGQYLHFPVIALPTMNEARLDFGFVLPRMAATFKEPNFFAGYLNGLIPLSISLLICYKLKGFSLFNNKIMLFFLLSIQLLALVLSFSTAGIIAFVFGICFFALLAGAKIKTIRLKIAGLVILLIALGYILIQIFDLGNIVNMVVFDKIFSTAVNPITHSRIERTEQAWGALTLFMSHPVLGVGLGNFGLYFDQVLGIKYGFEATANNVFAELLAETGLIGLALFLWFYLSMFKRFYLAYRRLSVGEDLFLLIGIWTAVFAILVSWNFFPSYSLSFFWVIFGLAIGYLRSLEDKLNGGNK